ncbi:hypothetical protein TNCV_3606221 [Trichonephila clavipes]|nr:hypothetical protein TNCV_3606221 [Trichonephila clavipes]
MYIQARFGTIGVSSRPKLTGIVRGKSIFTCFAQTSDRVAQTHANVPIMPDVMDMMRATLTRLFSNDICAFEK